MNQRINAEKLNIREISVYLQLGYVLRSTVNGWILLKLVLV